MLIGVNGQFHYYMVTVSDNMLIVVYADCHFFIFMASIVMLSGVNAECHFSYDYCEYKLAYCCSCLVSGCYGYGECQHADCHVFLWLW